MIICIFYDESIRVLIDMLILKSQNRDNTKIYIIDNGYKWYNIKIEINSLQFLKWKEYSVGQWC